VFLPLRNRTGIVLAALAALSCLAAAVLFSRTPMMSGHRTPIVLELIGMIAIPLAASGGAVWAAWAGRWGVLIALTTLVGAFYVVTGFSIGPVFMPALILLLWATLATISAADSQAKAR
jgi:hypothetical protein